MNDNLNTADFVPKAKSTTQWSQFIPLVSVFFFWGFVAASNDILIPVFKKAFNLNNVQSQLVSFAFYISYSVGSILLLIISKSLGKDFVEKIGFKNSLVIGLLISAVGTLLFYPAANTHSFPLMLTGLFMVALGFSLQQIVANPLAILTGPINTGSQRLTMAGGINNLGTTIGPLIVSFAIFGSISSGNTEASIDSVKIPYLILGVAFVLVALLIKYSSIPNHMIEEEDNNLADISHENDRGSALKYPQLVLGMIGIFVYVGVEVSTASNMPSYMEDTLGFNTKDIAPYISLYWASLMIGRWGGAVEAFTSDERMQKILKFVAPYLAFGVFLSVNAIAGHDISHFFTYGAIILILILADISSKGDPARMLLIFSILGIVALVIGMLSSGMMSVFAFTSVGLYCSTLWPCIFTLAISGLGKHVGQGSSFLIMMICGGAFISLLQGYLGDIIGAHYGYIVGVMCFAYLAFYAVYVKKILRTQGISFDKKIDGGH